MHIQRAAPLPPAAWSDRIKLGQIRYNDAYSPYIEDSLSPKYLDFVRISLIFFALTNK